MIVFRKKKIAVLVSMLAVLLLLGYLLISLIFGAVKVKKPSPSSQIFIEQVWQYNESNPKKIEITIEDDYIFLLNLFSKKYIAINDSPACPFGALRISFVYDGEIIEFYPATDDCERIMYGDSNKVFDISKEEKEMLNQLWQRYGFLKIYV